MSEVLFFAIIFLAFCIYATLGTFLNWESCKKSYAKGRPFTLFDKIIAIALSATAIWFLIFVIIKGY